MEVRLSIQGKNYSAELAKGLSLAIPLHQNGPRCFHVEPLVLEPLRSGDFVGKITEGSSVNFYNAFINPHGHGTHTECLGHIRAEQQILHEQLLTHHFTAQLISVSPVVTESGDHIIQASALDQIKLDGIQALIIRSYPNSEAKKKKDYSGTNPPYFSEEFIQRLVEADLQHLLTDLPSVDREEDGGNLLAHNKFWSQNRVHCTITEMIYVPDEINDGLYLLNLQITTLQLDASPSNPIIFPLKSASINE